MKLVSKKCVNVREIAITFEEILKIFCNFSEKLWKILKKFWNLRTNFRNILIFGEILEQLQKN